MLLDRNCVCKVADFGLYYHNFKYGHGNAKKVSNIVSWLHFKQLTVATSELSFPNVNMQIYGCRLSSQGCVPVKWTAPEVLRLGILKNFPAKVMCMYFFRSNYDLIFFLVKA